MRAFLWRLVYAVVCVFVFWLVFPLFLAAIGLPLPGNVMALFRVVIPCIALLYVIFGPEPPYPW
jgi:putative effector of murein hydrolase LrgA (UPF0299 family)